jgi:hypothetical protein
MLFRLASQRLCLLSVHRLEFRQNHTHAQTRRRTQRTIAQKTTRTSSRAMVASFISTDIESCEPQQHPRHRISPAQKDHAGGPAGSRTLRTSVAPTANWLASDCSCDHSPTTPGLSCLVGAGQTPTASVSRLTSFERSEVKVCCWSASAARSSSICRFTCGEGGNKPRRQTAVTHPRATQHPHPMRCRSYLGQLRHHRAGLLGAEQLRAGGALPDRHRVAAHVQLRWVERRRGVRCSRCEKRTERAWFIRLCSENWRWHDGTRLTERMGSHRWSVASPPAGRALPS